LQPSAHRSTRSSRIPQSSRKAKYVSISNDLRGRITGGEFPAGGRLPGQRALAEAYGVTLVTVRQALQVLVDEGLIVQRQGRETLVTPAPAAYRLTGLRSLAEDLREQGVDVATDVLDRSVRRCAGWVLAAFGPGRALRLERVRTVRGKPAVHQVSWVREPYGPAIRDRDFVAEGLYGVLAGEGVAVHRASEVIRPHVLTARSAELLARPARTAAFLSERVTYDLSGAAVVADRAVILGSLLEIRAERSAGRVSVHWGTSR